MKINIFKKSNIANKQQASNYSDEELDDGECIVASFDSEEELADCSSSSR
jgi:hypothetical protein